MDARKVVRLAGVLIASQMRAGNSNANPRGFLGRPLAMAVIDAIAFVLLFSFSLFAGRTVDAVRPGLLEGLLGSFLPFVPLLGVAAVLVGGLMFELATTAKFANSDAVNWLPIRSVEYVVASSLALTVLYSLSIVVLGAIAIGLGIVTGMLPVALFAVALGVLGLVEGALLIEILRAVTQRAGSLGKKRGSAALVLRGAVFLLVILGFQLFFNPVILFDSVHTFGSLGPVAFAIPFLWGSDAVRAAVNGDLIGTLAGAAAQVGLLLGIAYLASRARSRFWVPSGGEVEFERHRFGERHAVLRALGLGPAGAALVTKDLRGILRRRELLPGLLLPFVIGILVVVQTRTQGGNSSGIRVFFQLGLLAWVAGLSALLLASASFGQERRGVVHLFVLPVRAAEVYRAKAAATLLVGLPVGVVLTVLGLVVYRPSLELAFVMFAIVAVVVAEATAIGLAFGSRYSDFQDRPRPQFVRSIPMLVATAVYFLVGGATGGLAFLLVSGFLPGTLAVPILVVGAVVVLALVVAIVWLGASGVRRLLQELPS
jgi:predicted permease